MVWYRISKRDQVGCIILGKDTEIKEGTKVTRTKKKAGVPVGDAYLGRIVNALGAPIDGKGEIPADDYRAIEQEAPGIVDRQSVEPANGDRYSGNRLHVPNRTWTA